MTKIRNYCRNIFFVLSTLILSPIFYFGAFLNEIKGRKEKLRILLIQKGKIGDLVCISGMFRAIKEKYPDSYLALLASTYNADIVTNNPYLDEIIKFDDRRHDIGYFIEITKELKKRKFRFSIGLENINFVFPFWSMIPFRIALSTRHLSISSKILSIFNSHNVKYKDNDTTVKYCAKVLNLLDIDIPAIEINLFIDEKSERKAENFLKEKGLSESDFLVGVSPTAGATRLKEWETDKWITLSNLLIDNLKAKIILIGAPKDFPVLSRIQGGTGGRAIDSSGFTLKEIAALLKKLKICITLFNAPMHIADGVGTPIVAIAGPGNFHNQPPLGKRTKIICHPLPCHPCVSFTKTARFCKEGHHLCMKDIEVEEVYDAVLSMINLCTKNA